MYLNGVFIFKHYTTLLMSSHVVRYCLRVSVCVSHFENNVIKKQINTEKRITNLFKCCTSKIQFFEHRPYFSKKKKLPILIWNQKNKAWHGISREKICKNNIARKIHGIDCCSCTVIAIVNSITFHLYMCFSRHLKCASARATRFWILSATGCFIRIVCFPFDAHLFLFLLLQNHLAS